MTLVLVLCQESIFGRQLIIVKLIGESFVFLVASTVKKLAWLENDISPCRLYYLLAAVSEQNLN